jgi:hypothetical protein
MTFHRPCGDSILLAYQMMNRVTFMLDWVFERKVHDSSIRLVVDVDCVQITLPQGIENYNANCSII